MIEKCVLCVGQISKRGLSKAAFDSVTRLRIQKIDFLRNYVAEHRATKQKKLDIHKQSRKLEHAHTDNEPKRCKRRHELQKMRLKQKKTEIELQQQVSYKAGI